MAYTEQCCFVTTQVQPRLPFPMEGEETGAAAIFKHTTSTRVIALFLTYSHPDTRPTIFDRQCLIQFPVINRLTGMASVSPLIMKLAMPGTLATLSLTSILPMNLRLDVGRMSVALTNDLVVVL